MTHAINDEALDILFRKARSQNKWQKKPVTPQILMAVYDLMRWGPTTANTQPCRIVFLMSQEAKERLRPHLDPGNIEKTMTAPAVAILAYDLEFARNLHKTFPHNPEAPGWYKEPKKAEVTAFRNASLQGAYFMLAARAIGLDCGPMSGFDNAGVDREFFPGGTVKSNFLCGVGYGDPGGVLDRLPRLAFDEACKIL
ncbi:MAG: malonic semialdehyde reductase [Alphaproteobacteria bacterium]